MAKKTLLVIDLQNDYFPGGKFPLWKAEETLTQVEKAVRQANDRGIPVILVQHTVNPGNSGALFFEKGTDGVELHQRILAVAKGAPVIVKEKADAFLGTNLDETLAGFQTSELLVCGMMTQNCVTHTALSRAAEKYAVTVLADCCTTVDEMIHKIALSALSSRVRLSGWEEALAESGGEKIRTELVSASRQRSLPGFSIRKATVEDVPLVLRFILELAEYEGLAHEVEATEDLLRETLFGNRSSAEVVFACHEGIPVGFALYFQNFSTFQGRPGIYLEDLYVKPAWRGKGYGTALLAFLAKLTVNRNGGRLEWGVLTWNTPAREYYVSIGAKPQERFLLNRVEGQELKRLAERLPEDAWLSAPGLGS